MIEHKSFIKSFHYAWQGIMFAFRNNQNIRVQVCVAIIVMLVSVLLNINGSEMGILGVMILLVISAEMINTSLEEMTNLITTEHRKEAKIAKDVSAGMVLVVSGGAVIVGILILLPHILRLFGIVI